MGWPWISFVSRLRVLGYAIGDQCSQLDPGSHRHRRWPGRDDSFGIGIYKKCVADSSVRASPFYQQSPIPPHEPTTQFEWAIGGDAAAAFGVARKAHKEPRLVPEDFDRDVLVPGLAWSAAMDL